MQRLQETTTGFKVVAKPSRQSTVAYVSRFEVCLGDDERSASDSRISLLPSQAFLSRPVSQMELCLGKRNENTVYLPVR